MGIKAVTAYSMTCDGCKKVFEGDYFTIWMEQADLIEVATESEWTTNGIIWHCWDCPTLSKCECCGQPAGELSGERDYHCQACWDSMQPEPNFNPKYPDDKDGHCTINHVGIALQERLKFMPKTIASDVTITGEMLYGAE